MTTIKEDLQALDKRIEDEKVKTLNEAIDKNPAQSDQQIKDLDDNFKALEQWQHIQKLLEKAYHYIHENLE